MNKGIVFILFVFSSFVSLIVNAQSEHNLVLLDNWDVDTLPLVLGATYNDVWGWADGQGNEYAMMGSPERVHFFKIGDDNKLYEIDNFKGGGKTAWRDMKTYKNYCYAVADAVNEGMMIFDLSYLPDSIHKVNQIDVFFSRSHNLFIDEAAGRLYAAGTNTQYNGLIVLDIATNPEEPTLLGAANLPGEYVHDLFVRDNIAYCNSGRNGLYVYDYIDPTSPIALGALQNYPEKGYNHSCWLTDDSQHLVFMDETHNTGVKIADVSDPTDINVTTIFRSKLLAPSDSLSVGHNPLIKGDFLYLSYYHDGIQIYDISDPNNAKRLTYYDTEPLNTSYDDYLGAWGVYPFLPSGRILGSDLNNGLFLLRHDIFPEVVCEDENDEINTIESFCILPNNISEDSYLLIQTTEDVSGNIEVFDMTGKLIRKPMMVNINRFFSYNFNADDLSPGIYFVRLSVGKEQIIRRFYKN